MDDVYPIYEGLWRRAETEGAIVRYSGRPGSGAAGMFYSTHFPKPTILVMRPYYKPPSDEPSRESDAPPPLAQPDIHEEMITLAHEYGHFRSWAEFTDRAEYEIYDAVIKLRDAVANEEVARIPEGLSKQARSDRLRTALYGALNDNARTRIVHEETLAWQVGRRVLADLGLQDFAVYDERARTGLHNHRYRLGMDDLWPGDV